jgi:hypothetical protein
MILDLSTKEKEIVAQVMKNALDRGDISGTLAEKICKKVERSQRQIKPRSAKNKGASWQKEMCEMIARITGTRFDQKDDQCDIHSREMGLSGADIIVRGRARLQFDFDPECKNCNSISIPEWVRQAKANSKNGKWVLFVKSPKLEENIAVMGISQFESIVSAGNIAD